MPSTPPLEQGPSPASPFPARAFAHFSRGSSVSTPTPSPSSSSTHSTARPETRSAAAKRAGRPSAVSSSPSSLSSPPRVPLAPSVVHPSSTADRRDRVAAATRIPPGAQLMDPNGLVRVQSKPRRDIGTLEAWRIWYSSLTVGSMFEQWEVIFVHSVILGLLILLGCALAYFPPHVAHVVQRWRYYLSGCDL